MKKLPYLLIGFRLLLGPFMIYLSYRFGDGMRLYLTGLLFAGILSDIFDGIIARRQNIATASLRRMDSQTDLIFWLCAGWCAWLLHPEIVLDNRYAILLLFAMEGLTYVFSIAKFGKETCTHALLSKLWGIMLFVAFAAILGFGYTGIPFALAITFGVISHIDVYLIILFLPKWTHDVPSAWHAWQLRKGREITKYKIFNG